jgi:hypothetical protein
LTSTQDICLFWLSAKRKLSVAVVSAFQLNISLVDNNKSDPMVLLANGVARTSISVVSFAFCFLSSAAQVFQLLATTHRRRPLNDHLQEGRYGGSINSNEDLEQEFRSPNAYRSCFASFSALFLSIVLMATKDASDSVPLQRFALNIVGLSILVQAHELTHPKQAFKSVVLHLLVLLLAVLCASSSIEGNSFPQPVEDLTISVPFNVTSQFLLYILPVLVSNVSAVAILIWISSSLGAERRSSQREVAIWVLSIWWIIWVVCLMISSSTTSLQSLHILLNVMLLVYGFVVGSLYTWVVWNENSHNQNILTTGLLFPEGGQQIDIEKGMSSTINGNSFLDSVSEPSKILLPHNVPDTILEQDEEKHPDVESSVSDFNTVAVQHFKPEPSPDFLGPKVNQEHLIIGRIPIETLKQTDLQPSNELFNSSPQFGPSLGDAKLNEGAFSDILPDPLPSNLDSSEQVGVSLGDARFREGASSDIVPDIFSSKQWTSPEFEVAGPPTEPEIYDKNLSPNTYESSLTQEPLSPASTLGESTLSDSIPPSLVDFQSSGAASPSVVQPIVEEEFDSENEIDDMELKLADQVDEGKLLEAPDNAPDLGATLEVALNTQDVERLKVETSSTTFAEEKHADQSVVTRDEKRANVINEIIMTEETYIGKLSLLMSEFVTPLTQMAEKGELKQSKEDIKGLFKGIGAIYAFHQSFYEKLKKAGPNQIGRVFKDCAQFFKMYTDYVNEFDGRSELISKFKKDESKKKVDRFSGFLREKRKANVEELQSLMITPVQRIPRYLLLLRELIKYTDESAVMTELQEAYDVVERSCQHVNLSKKDVESSAKMSVLQSLIMGYPEDLIKPGRKLLREDELLRKVSIANIKHKKPTLVYLFNDMLLWTGKNHNFLGRFDIWTITMKKRQKKGDHDKEIFKFGRKKSTASPNTSGVVNLAGSSSFASSFILEITGCFGDSPYETLVLYFVSEESRSVWETSLVTAKLESSEKSRLSLGSISRPKANNLANDSGSENSMSISVSITQLSQKSGE